MLESQVAGMTQPPEFIPAAVFSQEWFSLVYLEHGFTYDFVSRTIGTGG